MPVRPSASSTQNVTVKMDRQLLSSARMLAASRNLSLSELFAELTRKTLAEDAAFRARRKRFRERLEKGYVLNTRGKLSVDRAELHEP